MSKVMCLLFCSLFLVSALAQTVTEKEQELVNYDNIKNILIEDNLDKAAQRKTKLVKKIQTSRNEREVAKYIYPRAEDFWDFMSRYWLVKNAQQLQWDFQKPDYGIISAFVGLMEKLGHYNKKFMLMVFNSPEFPHMGLPSNDNEYIFLISLPFMRTLDLSKVEIALLMLEDYFRLEAEFFKKNLGVEVIGLGDNFHGKKPNLEQIHTLAKNYSNVIFKKGFDFKQQHFVTMKMHSQLITYPELWSSYVNMLKKIDRLIKLNLMYSSYNNIYPSPELQLKWLSPKKSGE